MNELMCGLLLLFLPFKKIEPLNIKYINQGQIDPVAVYKLLTFHLLLLHGPRLVEANIFMCKSISAVTIFLDCLSKTLLFGMFFPQ